MTGRGYLWGDGSGGLQLHVQFGWAEMLALRFVSDGTTNPCISLVQALYRELLIWLGFVRSLSIDWSSESTLESVLDTGITQESIVKSARDLKQNKMQKDFPPKTLPPTQKNLPWTG